MSGAPSFAESQPRRTLNGFFRRIMRAIVCAVRQGIVLPRGAAEMQHVSKTVTAFARVAQRELLDSL